MIVRPTVAKTFAKGLIGIGAFSVFLQVSWANFFHYLIFLSISLCFLMIVIMLKRTTTIELGEESIIVRRSLRAAITIMYLDIIDVSVSQGILAQWFHCGSIFLVLRKDKGNGNVVGGGVAEQLEDIPYPERISNYVSSRLSPNF